MSAEPTDDALAERLKREAIAFEAHGGLWADDSPSIYRLAASRLEIRHELLASPLAWTDYYDSSVARFGTKPQWRFEVILRPRQEMLAMLTLDRPGYGQFIGYYWHLDEAKRACQDYAHELVRGLTQ
jgi:hypothetical protein